MPCKTHSWWPSPISGRYVPRMRLVPGCARSSAMRQAGSCGDGLWRGALHQAIPSTASDPADTAERRDKLRRILRAIDELPEGEREATILYYLKDRSQKAVASLLHLPVTTVNNRLHAARVRLKGELLPVMERTLAQSALPADFAEAVGRIVRIAGTPADGVPMALGRLGARRTGAEPLETGIKVIDLLCP